ncbi:MAG: nuclear transport factor 2 family protein [Solirubrobacterales bacterium]
MSQENVELVRSCSEAYVAGDIDGYLEFMAEDVEVRPDASLPDAKPFRGRQEFKSFLTALDQGWEGRGRAGIREVLPVGDRVVAQGDWGGKGRASGIDLRSNLTAIYTIRDGRITRVEYFLDHAEALEAAGLLE